VAGGQGAGDVSMVRCPMLRRGSGLGPGLKQAPVSLPASGRKHGIRRIVFLAHAKNAL